MILLENEDEHSLLIPQSEITDFQNSHARAISSRRGVRFVGVEETTTLRLKMMTLGRTRSSRQHPRRPIHSPPANFLIVSHSPQSNGFPLGMILSQVEEHRI